jgi:thiamine-monophosphate kinase
MRGEFELIAALRERLERAGAATSDRLTVASGDDAAISVPGGATATSVDAVVEGVHFRRGTFDPRAIGVKALAAALSDLAAMGAGPGEAYVQLGVPPDVPEEELLEVADGIAELAAREGVAVPGGDVVASPVLFLAVTAVGHAPAPDALVTRSGARPGDVLLLTGPLGGAAAGLLLLEGRAAADCVPDGVGAALRARQLEPRPLLHAGLTLARAGATAMIDVSDGLAADAGHLASASGLLAEIDVEAVPAQPGVDAVATAAGVERDELVLGGGEDYELLAAVPAERVDAARAALGESDLDPAVVGRVEIGEGVILRGATGRALAVRGYDQIHSPARDAPT